MRKRITAVDPTPIRVVLITLDSHVASAVERARAQLSVDMPGLELSFHAATEWNDDPASLATCRADIARGDIIFTNMLFMEDHIQAVLPDLSARREACDAMVCAMSAGEVIRLTRLGAFRMDAPQKGPLALLKKLRGSKKAGGSSGVNQMKMLRRLPKILRFIPGKAQDVRAYFLTLQYWLAASDTNLANLVRFLVNRYADGDRASLKGSFPADAPIEYPDVGLYHPRLHQRITTSLDELRAATDDDGSPRPTVGVLVMRSYVLAGDTRHYDAVIESLTRRGLRVVPAFASGLDGRPAIEAYFMHKGNCTVDALLSLTGFSLVGGPAFNDAKAAEEMLARLDVPYLSAQAIEFQSIEQWAGSARGLLPVESTIMVAIPELDGATNPMVFAGRPDASSESEGDAPATARGHMMEPIADRVETLSSRVHKLIELRRTSMAERNIAIVLFNFPPNGGAVGTAAHLSVFESLLNTLQGMHARGYDVDLPSSVDELRTRVLEGNAHRFGAEANVHYRVPIDDHVRREVWLSEIEAQWGPAPGRQQTDGVSIHVLGAQFGRVFVGIQPAFGYEGDPMRLLFENGFTPTHAFSAFYRYLKEDFRAHAVLHFGTHGALEFMPGKQAGLSAQCWPDRLIGDLPNFYLYAANNPSEGTLAKRRSAATLVSYLTPPLTKAGLYQGLTDLRASLDRWRMLPPEQTDERLRILPIIRAQAIEIDLLAADAPPLDDAAMGRLSDQLTEYERTLIPQSLHIVGQPATLAERVNHLSAVAELTTEQPALEAIEALVAGATPHRALAAGRLATDTTNIDLFKQLQALNEQLAVDWELESLLHALDGGFIRPAPGGDLLRNPDVLPTGRNVHGFDPFRIPSAFAVADGARQAERLLQRHLDDGHPLPESLAMVLWGTDNLKTEGGPIGQVLALVGARPRFDSYGRIAGASLIPLEELGRPRIDVVVTLSGIFRDLLPLQTRLLAEAAYLAATADEPAEQNYIRRNALAYMQQHGCDIETAALRVFSNADGAYGSNVSHLIDSGAWNAEDELAETYERRKCYAYGRSGNPVRQQALLQSALANVQLTYQNLESVELGVTTIDHYFDTLGGIGRAVNRARGGDVPVYIGDQTRGEGTVRTLGEQVSLESRTRVLNPKWYEGMLKHGAEGVRQIEAHITNTMGWSATTGQVAPWVYKQMSQTFVLDPEMRRRLAELNPKASAKLAHRLLEAHERDYWQPDPSTLEALRQAGDELEDRLEGISETAAA